MLYCLKSLFVLSDALHFIFHTTRQDILRMVRDFVLRWTCVIPQHQSHHLQESLSATANRSHLSLTLSFLCVSSVHLVSNKTPTSKMPPFFLFLFFDCFYSRWKRAVRFCIGVWLRLHCRNLVCQVFFLPLYCYVLWHRDMVSPEYLCCIQK